MQAAKKLNSCCGHPPKHPNHSRPGLPEANAVHVAGISAVSHLCRKKTFLGSFGSWPCHIGVPEAPWPGDPQLSTLRTVFFPPVIICSSEDLAVHRLGKHLKQNKFLPNCAPPFGFSASSKAFDPKLCQIQVQHPNKSNSSRAKPCLPSKCTYPMHACTNTSTVGGFRHDFAIACGLAACRTRHKQKMVWNQDRRGPPTAALYPLYTRLQPVTYLCRECVAQIRPPTILVTKVLVA